MTQRTAQVLFAIMVLSAPVPVFFGGLQFRFVMVAVGCVACAILLFPLAFRRMD